MVRFIKKLIGRSMNIRTIITQRFPPPPPLLNIRYFSSEKSVCLVGRITRNDETLAQIYKINLTNSSSSTSISPLYEARDGADFGIDNTIMLSSGSSLHFFGGGQWRNLDSFKSFDVTNPDAGIQRRPGMRTLRSSTVRYATTVLPDGRIYVFGGQYLPDGIYVFGGQYLYEETSNYWSEFYDPVNDNWVPLNKSSYNDLACSERNQHYYDRLYASLIFGDMNKPMIMVRGNDPNTVFVHNVDEGSSFFLEDQDEKGKCKSPPIPYFGFRGMSEAPVRVGDVMYWLNWTSSGISIESYNISSKMCSSGLIESWYPIQWEEIGTSRDKRRCLIHLGGEHDDDDDHEVFCYITGDNCDSTKVCCTIFKVSKHFNCGYSDVSVLERLSYKLSGESFELKEVFPM